MNEHEFVAKMVDETGLVLEDKLKLAEILHKLYKKYSTAKTNHDMGELFMTNQLFNYMKAYNISNTGFFTGEQHHNVNNIWLTLFNKVMHDYDGLDAQEKMLMHCLRYFFLTEMQYSEVVSQVCFILVWQASTPIKIPGRRKHTTNNTIREISDNISLGNRIKFLQENGFEDLAGAFDQDFRNAIAHNDIIIGEPKLTTSNLTIEGDNIKMRGNKDDSFTDVDIMRVGPTLDRMTTLYMNAFRILFRVRIMLPIINAAEKNGEKYKLSFEAGEINFKVEGSPNNVND